MKYMNRILLVLLSASALFADGFIIFPVTYETPLTVKYHKVTCTIDNGIASTTVDQEFVNTRDIEAESGRYVFPLPAGATVEQFKVVVDGEAKTATLMSREEAREFFTLAVKNSNQASLLEYTDNGAYTLEIGSVAPGASRKVQISYVEVLRKVDGLTGYLYPLNTEKYSMELIDTVSIMVQISNTTPITSVYSPSYPVVLERTDDNHVTVSYISTKSRPGRDFDLYYKLSENDISFHLFTSKKENEDGYFLMLITPRIPEPDVEVPVAKDIVFTIDKSGSMSGTKITQARDALRFCINQLRPDDYFNIVAFQSTVGSNAGTLLPATAENLGAVQLYVDSINATGGTNISGALTTALSRMNTEGERPHYCIFLTDGRATSGETNAAKISRMVNEANTSGTRIFSVGFGFDVNTILLDKISMDNGGFPLYCSPDQNIDEVIAELYKRIESPILTSPQLTFDGAVEVYAVGPQKLNDLFTGSEIAVYGRYKGAGTSVVTLTGYNGEVVPLSLAYPAVFPASEDAYPFIPRLWATQQIANLMTKIKLMALTQEDVQPLVDSVTTLSLEYGIVTPYTSSLFVPGGAPGTMTERLQEESGGAANDASNFMQGMQQNSNAAQTVVADTNSLPYNVAPQVNQMQNVGNKIFVFTADSLWQDAAYDSGSACDTVLYGSDEYFTLAAQNADIRRLFSVGSQAVFNYNGQNYLVLDRGTSAAHPENRLPAGRAMTQQLSIIPSGSGISFSRTVHDRNGTVSLYSIDGARIARLSFGNKGNLAYRYQDGRHAAGTYLAVYREPGLKMVQRFVLP